MIQFQKRILQRSKTLGERLKKVREESGLTLEAAAQATQIKIANLTALEEGNYALLPGPVYIESFLKRYAEYLGVSSEFVLSLYHQQEKKTVKKKYRLTLFSPPKQPMKEIITPRLIRGLIIGLVVAGCLVYVVFAIANIFSPPKLTIKSPNDYLTTSENSVIVQGSTQLEAVVMINGKQVFLDKQGDFSENIILKEGINEINISAKKEKSKATVVFRHIFYKPSP